MLFTDIVLVGALAVFVAAWLLRRFPARSIVLFVSALTALMAGVIGLVDDRWQTCVGVAAACIMLVALLVSRWRRKVSGGAPLVSGALFLLLGAAALAALVMFPVSPLPTPTGEHRVGVRTFELSDTSRLGVFHARADEPRRLLVRVWYPAADVANLKRRQYFSQQEAQTTARGAGTTLGFPRLFTYLKHVRTSSYEDAPLLARASRLPAILYSHGYTSFLGQHTTLMDDLASHGYVVFSVQHTFDSAATVFPNGDVLPVDPGMLEDLRTAQADGHDSPQIRALTAKSLDDRLAGHVQNRSRAIERSERTTVRSAATWVADRLFVHDRLQTGAVPANVADIVAGTDFSRVGEMGMSFGGSTSGAICMIDARCGAGVNLDGWDIHFTAFNADIPVPFLMLHSDLENFYRYVGAALDGELRSYNEFSYERIATAGSRADVYRLQLAGAQHAGLSDFSLFVRRPLRDALFGTAPADVLIGAQREVVRGFFDRYLRGATNGFPQLQMAAYEGWISRLDDSTLRGWWAAKTEAERASLEERIENVRRAANTAGASGMSSTASATEGQSGSARIGHRACEIPACSDAPLPAD